MHPTYGARCGDRHLDAILARAEAALADDLIPAEIFNDAAVFRAEADRIFGRSWVFVAHESEIPKPGDVSNANAPACSDISYRDEFSGTSSAGPVVASSAAVLSSIAQERGYLLKSQEVRDLLKKTGTPQGGSRTRNIGPLPNLHAAIDAMAP